MFVQIGHNFGAIHDQQTRCNSSAWLMSESGSSGEDGGGPPELSLCSQVEYSVEYLI